MSRPIASPSRRGHSLSRAQTMMLHGVIPIILIGLILPIGLIALVLAIESAPIEQSVDQGVLFLAAGNSAFIGCISLISSRVDQAVNAMIAAFTVFALIVVPAYLCWAILAVRDMQKIEYSKFFAVGVGGAFAGLAVIVALVFVWLSYRPPVISSRA